ncbi:hypothetical protein MTO96_042754, partial [Rhipicephalus appendiculatus]
TVDLATSLLSCEDRRQPSTPAAPRPSRSVRHKENADLREEMEPYIDWCRSLRLATRVTVSTTKMAVATSAAAVALPTAALVAPFNPKASAKLAENCFKMFTDSVDGLPPATESTPEYQRASRVWRHVMKTLWGQGGYVEKASPVLPPRPPHPILSIFYLLGAFSGRSCAYAMLLRPDEDRETLQTSSSAARNATRHPCWRIPALHERHISPKASERGVT